jgi:hypothetical protein
MSIKINQTIESINGGTLTEAVVRIENYRINKFNGKLEITVVMFKNEEEAAKTKLTYVEDGEGDLYFTSEIGPISPNLTYNGQKIEYPTLLIYNLSTPETVTEDVYEERTETRPFTTFDEDGNVVESTREVKVRVKNGTREVTKNKIDITVIGDDVYSYAYARIKESFGEIFGASNITDC